MKRAMIFIDGNNFYFKLRDAADRAGVRPHLVEFDYAGFTKWLTDGMALAEVRYYIGAVVRQSGNGRSEELYASQQKLFAKLQRAGVKFVLGHLIRHPDGTYHEKGVDVRIAVEMIRFAHSDAYDVAYLLSSDTDLVAAVEEVKLLGKKVHYVGFAKGQSFGLTKAADDVRLLRPEDIILFLPK